MNGFFEHQYLSYKKNHIKNLLALAKADGFVHEKEQKMLFKIGKRYGLKDRQVQELINNDEKYSVNVPDNFNDQMNVLYDLVLMVWADGVVEKKEIDFCEALVKRFGMKKEIVKWLLHEVFEKGTPPPPDEWDELKQEAKEKFAKK
ncbi:MAG: TerB family tellurite resistance protein [Bacteroidetes bacterium]|nr:TerB family tellurite resistance protein [Bacteroidota bacterium]